MKYHDDLKIAVMSLLALFALLSIGCAESPNTERQTVYLNTQWTNIEQGEQLDLSFLSMIGSASMIEYRKTKNGQTTRCRMQVAIAGDSSGGLVEIQDPSLFEVVSGRNVDCAWIQSVESYSVNGTTLSLKLSGVEKTFLWNPPITN